jgi:cytochrome c oxidase cbb3-type subunit II
LASRAFVPTQSLYARLNNAFVLFEVRKGVAKPGEVVLTLPPDWVRPGEIVIAKPEVLALVDYLLSLDHTYIPLPAQ